MIRNALKESDQRGRLMVFGRFVKRRSQTPEREGTLEGVARKAAIVDQKLLKGRDDLDISASRLFAFFAEHGIIDADPAERRKQGMYAVSEIHSYGLETRTDGGGGILMFDILDGRMNAYKLVRIPRYPVQPKPS